MIDSTVSANDDGLDTSDADTVLREDTIADNADRGLFALEGQTTLTGSILAGDAVDCNVGIGLIDGGTNLVGIDDSEGARAARASPVPTGMSSVRRPIRSIPVSDRSPPTAARPRPRRWRPEAPRSARAAPATARHHPSTTPISEATPVARAPAGRVTSVPTTPAVCRCWRRSSSASGPAAGGRTITIDGANLAGANAVTIGGAPATDVQVVSPEMVTALTPAHAPGDAVITVTTGLGKASLPAKDYTYQKEPAAP